MKRAYELYLYLIKWHPAFPANRLTYSTVISHAFRDHTTKKNVQNSLSDLYQWAADFLIWQKSTRAGLQKELAWLDILRERRLNHEYQLRASRIDKKLEQTRATDAQAHLDRLFFHHHVWSQQAEERYRPREESLRRAMDQLEQFYLISKMTYGTELLNREQIYSEAMEHQELEELSLKAEQYKGHLPLDICRMLYQLVKEGKEETYLSLKKLLVKRGSVLSKATNSILFQHLINFTAGKIREQESQYYHEAFELFDFALQAGILTDGQYLSSNTFQNIATIALRLHKTDWASSFVDQFSRYIQPKSMYLTTCYVRALIAFNTGDHQSDWFRKLQEIKLSNPFIAIRVKTLIIRNMYEAKEERGLLLLFNAAFRKYLSRNKQVKGAIYQSAVNFSNCFRKLVNRRVSRSDFIEEVKNSTHIHFGGWLLTKASDLNED
ncbi:MAG: hypothetical protein AAFZ15_17670 [Bacteroidota bacterium]